jgi:hypothetical protein
VSRQLERLKPREGMSDLAEGDPALRLLAQEDIAAVVFGIYFHQHCLHFYICIYLFPKFSWSLGAIIFLLKSDCRLIRLNCQN